MAFDSLSDLVRMLANYLDSVWRRRQSIDSDSPLARQTRMIGFALFVVFILLPALFLLALMYFPEWFTSIIGTPKRN